MALTSEDSGGGDGASHATAGGCEADDADVGDMLELFLAELDALERHGECVFHDDDDLIMASIIATTDAGITTGLNSASTRDSMDVATAIAEAAPAVKESPRKRKRIRPTGAVNTHYKRQKEELAALRGGVEALKSQLELLHARQRGQRCSENSRWSRRAATSGGGCAGEDDDKGARKRGFDNLAALKARAARELESRQQTTLENAKLRKLAEDTREFTRRMEGAFAKHPMPSMGDLFEVSPVLRVIGPTDAQVYRELECCLDARYAGVSLMREGFGCCPGVENSVNDLRTISTLVENELDASVLVNNSRVLPFPVQFISDVVWGGDNLDLLHAKNAAIKIVQRFESTVFLNKQYNVRDPDNQEVVVTMQMVLRRFAAKDCIYLAWESLGEWPSASSTTESTTGGVSATSKRFVIREHGWGSVLPFPNPKSRSPVSTLRASTIVEPDVVGDAYEEQSLHRARVQLLSDTVVPTHQVAFAARMQQLENMLLDHSIRSSRCE